MPCTWALQKYHCKWKCQTRVKHAHVTAHISQSTIALGAASLPFTPRPEKFACDVPRLYHPQAVVLCVCLWCVRADGLVSTGNP